LVLILKTTLVEASTSLSWSLLLYLAPSPLTSLIHWPAWRLAHLEWSLGFLAAYLLSASVWARI